MDDIIFFRTLSRPHLMTISDIQLARLEKRLEHRKVAIQLTAEAKRLLVAEGYDLNYGARPLKRTIQRLVLDPIAMRILKGEFR